MNRRRYLQIVTGTGVGSLAGCAEIQRHTASSVVHNGIVSERIYNFDFELKRGQKLRLLERGQSPFDFDNQAGSDPAPKAYAIVDIQEDEFLIPPEENENDTYGDMTMRSDISGIGFRDHVSEIVPPRTGTYRFILLNPEGSDTSIPLETTGVEGSFDSTVRTPSDFANPPYDHVHMVSTDEFLSQLTFLLKHRTQRTLYYNREKGIQYDVRNMTPLALYLKMYEHLPIDYDSQSHADLTNALHVDMARNVTKSMLNRDRTRIAGIVAEAIMLKLGVSSDVLKSELERMIAESIDLRDYDYRLDDNIITIIHSLPINFDREFTIIGERYSFQTNIYFEAEVKVDDSDILPGFSDPRYVILDDRIEIETGGGN